MEEEIEINDKYNIVIINNIKGNISRLEIILEKILNYMKIDYLILTGEVLKSEDNIQELSNVKYKGTILIFDSSETCNIIKTKFEYCKLKNIILLGKCGMISLDNTSINIAFLNGIESKEFLNKETEINDITISYKYFKYKNIENFLNVYESNKKNNKDYKIDFLLINNFPQYLFNRYINNIKEKSKEENFVLNEEKLNNISYTLNFLLYIINPRYVITSIDDFFFKNTSDNIINKNGYRTYFYHLGNLEEKINSEQQFYVSFEYSSINLMKENEISLMEQEYEKGLNLKFIKDDNLFKYYNEYNYDPNKSLMANYDSYLKLCFNEMKTTKETNIEEKHLFLSNINYDITEQELKEHLIKRYGPIKHLKYLTNKETNKFNGKAIVQFMNNSSTNDILNNSSKEKFHDRAIKATISTSKFNNITNNNSNLNYTEIKKDEANKDMNINSTTNSNDNITSNTECWFCYVTNKSLDKNFILKEYKYNYLSFSKGPINEYHLLIIPKRHVSFYNELNDEEKKECEIIIKLLSNYFSTKKCNFIIYEKNLKYNFKNSVHLLTNIVGFENSLITKLNDFAEKYFLNEKINHYYVTYNDKYLYLYLNPQPQNDEYIYVNIPFVFKGNLIRKIVIFNSKDYKIDYPRKLICLFINKEEGINWRDTLKYGEELLGKVKQDFLAFLNNISENKKMEEE